VLIVELDDAGVVLENADAPIVVAEAFAEFLGGAEDRFFKQIANPPRRRAAVGIRHREVDLALERFVRAMLGPGLGDRLQLDVAGIAA
jgi:hypothetical protein